MPFYHLIHRPIRAEDLEQTKQLREAINKSREILQQYPKPDTFLGRKMQEPFPAEDNE